MRAGELAQSTRCSHRERESSFQHPWCLTTAWSSGSRNSSTLFWSLWTLAHMWHTETCAGSHTYTCVFLSLKWQTLWITLKWLLLYLSLTLFYGALVVCTSPSFEAADLPYDCPLHPSLVLPSQASFTQRSTANPLFNKPIAFAQTLSENGMETDLTMWASA